MAEKRKQNKENNEFIDETLFADTINFRDLLKDLGVPKDVVYEMESIDFTESFFEY